MKAELKRSNGYVYAKFYKRLANGECPCNYDKNTYVVQDGIVYKRIK